MARLSWAFLFLVPLVVAACRPTSTAEDVRQVYRTVAVHGGPDMGEGRGSDGKLAANVAALLAKPLPVDAAVDRAACSPC